MLNVCFQHRSIATLSSVRNRRSFTRNSGARPSLAPSHAALSASSAPISKTSMTTSARLTGRSTTSEKSYLEAAPTPRSVSKRVSAQGRSAFLFLHLFTSVCDAHPLNFNWLSLFLDCDFEEKTMGPPNSPAPKTTAACRASKCRAA